MSENQSFYGAAREVESNIFALSPVPLGPLKSGIQQVGIPLAVTAAVTHAPIVGPLAGAAIQLGGDALQNGAHSLALEAMNNFGSSVMEGLPAFGGVQTSFSFVSSQMAQVALAGQDMAAHAVGVVGASLMMGRTAGNAAAMALGNARNMTINDVLDRGRTDIQKTQAFLSNAQTFVRQQGLKVEGLVDQGLAKLTEYAPSGAMANRLISMQEKMIGKTEQANINLEQTVNTKQENVPTMAEQSTESPNGRVKPVEQRSAPVEQQSAPVEQRSQQPIPDPTPQAKEPVEAEVNLEPLADSPQYQASLNDGQSNQPSESAEDYVLRTLVDKLGQRFDIERFNIKMNGKQIFKMNGAEVDSSTSITDAQQKIIQQALEDPAAFGGNMKITVGGKTLLHIQEGRLMTNPMGLAQDSAKIDVTTADQVNPSQALWTKYGQGQANNIKGLSNAAKLAAKDGVSQESIQGLLKQSPTYQDLAKNNQKQAESLMQKTAQKAVYEVGKQQPSQVDAQAQEQKETVTPGL